MMKIKCKKCEGNNITLCTIKFNKDDDFGVDDAIFYCIDCGYIWVENPPDNGYVLVSIDE